MRPDYEDGIVWKRPQKPLYAQQRTGSSCIHSAILGAVNQAARRRRIYFLLRFFVAFSKRPW